MYTILPVPQVEWNERSLRYAAAFLPAAGILTAAAEWLLFCLFHRTGMSSVFFGVSACGMSALITGGIHIDGLIDTSDALGSYGSREKKLAILDDPHTGAFGVAGAALCFLMVSGAMAELYGRVSAAEFAAVVTVFPLSRAGIAACIVRMKLSKERGLLWTFASGASKTGTVLSAIVVGMGCMAAVFALFGWSGVIPAAGFLLFFVYFQRLAQSRFGGLSGDLCGWFIEMSQLVMLLCFVGAAAVRA